MSTRLDAKQGAARRIARQLPAGSREARRIARIEEHPAATTGGQLLERRTARHHDRAPGGKSLCRGQAEGLVTQRRSHQEGGARDLLRDALARLLTHEVQIVEAGRAPFQLGGVGTTAHDAKRHVR